MLRSVNDLQQYSLLAKDGEMGKVYDCFFDDASWSIRYLVVDTGQWLPGRKVLLHPSLLKQPDWLQHGLPVQLTRKQIEESPDMDTEKPVSRQQELTLARYYGWPVYWTEPGHWPGVFTPSLPPPDASPAAEPPPAPDLGDSHLRSAREITGYHVLAVDGRIGHIDDFIMDDEAWQIRYLVVATRNWLPGRKVLLSPEWLDPGFDYRAGTAGLNLTRQEIRNSPKYDPAAPVNRQYEVALYDFYGRPGYWIRQDATERVKS